MSWGAPLTPNGQLEGYRVIYQPTAPVQGMHTHTCSHPEMTVHVKKDADLVFNCWHESRSE